MGGVGRRRVHGLGSLIAMLHFLALVQCGSSDEAVAPAPTADFVGTWKTSPIWEVTGTCYPPEYASKLPEMTFSLYSPASDELYVAGYGGALRVSGNTASIVGESSLTAHIPAAMADVTYNLKRWTLTIGSKPTLDYSALVETKPTAGGVTTCTLNLRADMTRTSTTPEFR